MCAWDTIPLILMANMDNAYMSLILHDGSVGILYIKN